MQSAANVEQDGAGEYAQSAATMRKLQEPAAGRRYGRERSKVSRGVSP